MYTTPQQSNLSNQPQQATSTSLSYPNFVWGLSFVDLLILASRLTVLDAGYSAKQGTIRCFNQECKNYQKWGQKGLFIEFLGPQLAQASLWLAWAPKLLQGEGTSSLWRALARPGELPLPPSAHFPINRGVREAKERFQGSILEGIQRIKKEKEEIKLRRCRIATVINLNIVPHFVFFVLSLVSFVFED